MGSRPTHYPPTEPPPRPPCHSSVLLSCLSPKGSSVPVEGSFMSAKRCVWSGCCEAPMGAWGHFRAWLPTPTDRTMGARPDTRLHCGALSGTHGEARSHAAQMCAVVAAVEAQMHCGVEALAIEAHPATSSRFPEEASSSTLSSSSHYLFSSLPAWSPWGHHCLGRIIL